MKHLKSVVCLFTIGILLLTVFTSAAQSQKKQSKKPLIVFVTGDHEYSGEETLPLIAAELEKNYGMRTLVLKASPDHNAEENIPGLEALKDADLAVFYLRWRRLPADQVKFIDDYLKSGKPVIGFRTSTHAFNYPKGHPLEKWNTFGEFALGAPGGWGKGGHTHYGHESSTDVAIIPAERNNPILTGVKPAFHVRSWLYHIVPDYPSKGATWLLMGTAVDPDKKAVENPVAWTWKTAAGGKVFTTTLGHPDDFKDESFQRLLINAMHWAVGKPIPKKWAGKVDIQVPYRQ